MSPNEQIHKNRHKKTVNRIENGNSMTLVLLKKTTSVMIC